MKVQHITVNYALVIIGSGNHVGNTRIIAPRHRRLREKRPSAPTTPPKPPGPVLQTHVVPVNELGHEYEQ